MGRMPWPTRRMDRNHSCQRPRHFVFVDTETRWSKPPRLGGQTEHSLRLGVACAVDWLKGERPTEEWFQFTGADDFWKWLRTKQRDRCVLWVIAHNMAFDFTILNGWGRLETKEYRIRTDGRTYFDPRTGAERKGKEWCGLVAIDGFPWHLEAQGEVGRVNFSDLMNYYRSPLSQLGKLTNVEKLPLPDQRDGDLAWFARCTADVEITKRAYIGLVRQWQEEDNGNWQLSGPALAWSHYRHRHLQNPVTLHAHNEARDLEWAAYFPGECRAWFRGTVPGPVLHLDVNSLYPAVMAGRQFPTELIDYLLTPKLGMFEYLLSKYLCVAEVDLDTEEDAFPYRHGGHVLFPCGRFTTALVGPELLRAWTGGHVRAVRKMALYKGARLFDSYVAQWWERKRDARTRGDPAGDKFAKLMLNSLPGKFCQRNPVWKCEPRIPVVRPWRAFPWKDPDTGCAYNARSVGWEGQYAAAREDSAHAFPAVGAFVTSYAREFMRELRRNVPPQCCYYQDTDSLMIADDPLAQAEMGWLPFGDRLGELREVGRYRRVTIRGPKNYTCDGVHTIAGVKSADSEIAPMSWVGERYETAGAVVTREPDGTVRTKTVDFETPGSCLEGGYTSDGWYFPINAG